MRRLIAFLLASLLAVSSGYAQSSGGSKFNPFTGSKDYTGELSDFTGTLTDGKVCTYNSGTNKIDCDSDAGSGDVSASANLTDNSVVRGDGGAKGVQDSGVIIDDSDNVTGLGTLSSASGTLTIDETASLTDYLKSAGTDNVQDANINWSSIDLGEVSGYNNTNWDTAYGWGDHSGQGYLTTVDISDNTNLVAGTNITLSDDTLNVDDSFLLNTGDTGTGNYIFSNSTDDQITIKNGGDATGARTNSITFEFSDGDGAAIKSRRGSAEAYTDSVLNFFSGGNTTNTKLQLGTTESVFNQGGQDFDFRVEGVGSANALFVQGSDGAVGVRNGSPSEALDVTGNIAVSGTVDGVDIAARDHDPVTLAGTPDYITLSGQVITRGTVDISDDTNLSCGTNCTLTGDEIGVDDAFLLNTGDVGTGVYDFGGATSVEIPNGTSPTVDATGEIAIDTTADDLIYYGGAKRSIPYEMSKDFTLESPADADNFLWFKAPYALTITDIECIVDPADSSESAVITVQECDGNGDSCAGVDGATTITCGNTTTSDDGTLSNGTIDADDYVALDIGTVTGTVSQLNVRVKYSKDAE